MSSSASPGVITYCYGGSMVYVSPADSYEQAIGLAQDSFPELKNVDRELISLEVRVTPKDQARVTVRIGRTAWVPVVSALAQYEIVHVCVPSRPAPVNSRILSTAEPPPYATDASSDEKAAHAGASPSGASGSRTSPPPSFANRVTSVFTRRPVY
ncbi:hypothetical protein BC834DRAFT_971935 [Gloeopeniophorella convolvens]|nr:hypothetical protein BC834DRAFT_971935 [Gloeopeniophorella convolvens]